VTNEQKSAYQSIPNDTYKPIKNGVTSFSIQWKWVETISWRIQSNWVKTYRESLLTANWFE